MNMFLIYFGSLKLHWYVQVGCLCELVTSLPVEITSGQNHITKTHDFLKHPCEIMGTEISCLL